jgi:hypothetical protein
MEQIGKLVLCRDDDDHLVSVEVVGDEITDIIDLFAHNINPYMLPFEKDYVNFNENRLSKKEVGILIRSLKEMYNQMSE